WRICGSQATSLTSKPSGTVIRRTDSSGENPSHRANPPDKLPRTIKKSTAVRIRDIERTSGKEVFRKTAQQGMNGEQTDLGVGGMEWGNALWGSSVGCAPSGTMRWREVRFGKRTRVQGDSPQARSSNAGGRDRICTGL